jgi:hypothetical protein
MLQLFKQNFHVYVFISCCCWSLQYVLLSIYVPSLITAKRMKLIKMITFKCNYQNPVRKGRETLIIMETMYVMWHV